jgi:ankyrin repeat protein
MAGERGEEFEREALHFACQDGDLERVRALVSGGSDLNAFDDLGMTPLHHAAKGEHLEVARYLLENGANVNAHEESTIGNTPLGEVAGSCSLRMAQLLIDAGADPRIPGWMQITALVSASERKREEGPVVHELLLRASRWLP